MSDARAVLRDAVHGLPVIRETAENALSDMRHTVQSAMSGAALFAAAAGDELHSVRAAWGGNYGSISGGGSSGDVVCDFCAAPFIHGSALAPEVQALQLALDSCDQDAHSLLRANRQLRQLELELAEMPVALTSCAASLRQSAVHVSGMQNSVSQQLERAEQHDILRDEEASVAREQAQAGRAQFLANLQKF